MKEHLSNERNDGESKAPALRLDTLHGGGDESAYWHGYLNVSSNKSYCPMERQGTYDIRKSGSKRVGLNLYKTT